MTQDGTVPTDIDTLVDQAEDNLRDEYVTWMDNILERGASLDELPGHLVRNDEFLAELFSELTAQKFGCAMSFGQYQKIACIKSILKEAASH